MRRFVLLAVALLAPLLGLQSAAQAATKTWNGPASGGSWSTASNWSPSGAPGAGDTVQFNTAVNSTADLGATVAIGAIVFGPNAGGSVINGAVVINSDAARLNIDDQSTSTTPNTIRASIKLTDPVVTGQAMFVIIHTAGHVLELRGAISGGRALAADTAILIWGPGTVWMVPLGHNTYTGRTGIASAVGTDGDGILQISGFSPTVVPGGLDIGFGLSDPASPTRPQVQVLTGDVISDTAQINIAADGLLVLNSGFSETIAQLTGTGSVSIASSLFTLTVGDASNFTFGGVIFGGGNINKVGTGTMTYTNTNTYTGMTTVSRGKLVLGAAENAHTIQGPVTIGSGVGSATTATLQLASQNQFASNTLPININSDGRLDLATFADSVGTVTMKGGNIAIGGNVLRVVNELNMTGGSVTGAGQLDIRTNAVATSSPAFGAATIDSNSLMLSGPNATFTINPGSVQPELTINALIQTGANSANLIKTGTGTMQLAGSSVNNYTGSTTINLGTLQLAKGRDGTPLGGPVVIGNNADAPGSAVLQVLNNDQQISGNSAVQINTSGTLNSNGLVLSIASLSGVGTVSLASGGLTLNNPPGTTATYAGQIVGSGGQVAKTGDGTQIFTQNNTYNGLTQISGGILTINGQQSGDFEVYSGTLTGAGRVGRVVLIAPGRLQPGLMGTGGTLSTVGDLVMGSSAQLIVDLASATVFGKVNVTGSVSLSPSTLTLIPAPGFSAPLGSVLEIVTNDGSDAVANTFAGLPQGATVSAGSRNFTISYVGGTGNDITLTVQKNTPVMTLSASPNPARAGSYANLRLTVNGVTGVTPSGTAAFSIAGTPVSGCAARPLSGGVATCVAVDSALVAGTHPVTATYSGDANYLAGSPSPISLVVASLTDPYLEVRKFGSGSGTVTSSPAGINCGSDCSEIYPDGTGIQLTAIADASSVFTGWGSFCRGPSASCAITVSRGNQLVEATFALKSVVGNAPNLDIDGDGKYLAATDGLLISRFASADGLDFPPAAAVAAPAVGGTATRITSTQIFTYLNDVYPMLDVDRDGFLSTTDSMLIVRYLLGFRGAALVGGLTLPAGMTAAIIEANIAAMMPVLP